ncbi:UDP-forming cellulose synthase catalytic subunit [Rhodobacteraceae bacterium DSL-40]|uniref:UDP-forming cellulose synthase catalytic subunit n=1 Tax=Amaricoccus sp. B4 TaxID=3368557 RepID=UPI000DAD1962
MIYHGISIFGSLARLVLWLAAFACLVALISVPTSLGVQALMGAAAICCVLVLRNFVNIRIWRLSLLGIASVIVMRYWFWRLFDTLPPFEDHASFAAAVVLFAVETYLIAAFFLSCLVVADPIDHRRPKPVKVRDLPTVDVLIPSMNEPTDLLAMTLSAAKNMAYPPQFLNVVLCDDGGTDERCLSPDPGIAMAARARRDELSALCEKLGVLYRTRPENRAAKAGNISDALATLNGELIAIFDADHAPSRDFLARTVGYFCEDEKLALVQTPHFFLNRDPIARNLKLPKESPPENEMFYSLMHKGLDRWGGAFFCGSAALLRREAIESVGGMHGRTITEDAETAIQIHGRGWRSMYVNHAMIAGLQPETMPSFLTQRGRWATGMIQILVLSNPFLLRGLSLWQRLTYLNSMVYWLFPVVRLLLLMAPLVYLFFGLEIVVTTAAEAFAYMGSYLAMGYLVQNILFANVRWPFISEVYEIAQAPYLLKGVLRAVVAPLGARFRVTSKDETISETRLTDVYRPLFYLFLLMLAGVGALAWRWHAYPGDRAVLQIVGAWAIFNTLLVGASLRSLVEQRQRRAAPRVGELACPAVAEFTTEAGAPIEVPCVITDISFSGIGIAIPPRALTRDLRRPVAGDAFRLLPTSLEGVEEIGEIVCTVTHGGAADGRLHVGASLSETQTREAYLTIAALLYGDSRRWQAIRERQTATRHGLIWGAINVSRLGVAGIWHMLRALLLSRGSSLAERGASTTIAGWSDETPIEAQAFIAARDAGSSAARRAYRPRPVPSSDAHGATGDERLNLA